MARKRKKKSTTPKGPGAYKQFLSRFYSALNKSGLSACYTKFKASEMQLMFTRIPNILPPISCNKLLSQAELKKMHKIIRYKLLDEELDIENRNATIYDILLMNNYCIGMQKRIARETGDKNNPEIGTFKDMENKFFKMFYGYYALLVTRVTLQIGNPCTKYIGIKMRIAAAIKENPVLEVVTELTGINAKKSHVSINGNYRPIYQLGTPDFQHNFRWVSLNNSLLPQTHQTEHESLSVHIQAHALRRLKERLNLLNTEAIHYALWKIQ